MKTEPEKNVAIETNNLSKSFEGKLVISKLNLKIFHGRSMGIMGPSGTGKSVLIKCILGLTDYEGKIFYRGYPLNKKTRKMFFNNFGMLFQGGALFDSLTVWQNIAFKLLNNGQKVSKKEALETAQLLLQDVGLNENVSNMMPAELSGGMQKRVALARALANKPNLLFFDEPTTGLDPVTSRSINQLISTIVKRRDITSLVISHDPSSINRICDDVLFMEGGNEAWKGKVSEMKNSGHKLLNDYLRSA